MKSALLYEVVIGVLYFFHVDCAINMISFSVCSFPYESY